MIVRVCELCECPCQCRWSMNLMNMELTVKKKVFLWDVPSRVLCWCVYMQEGVPCLHHQSPTHPGLTQFHWRVAILVCSSPPVSLVFYFRLREVFSQVPNYTSKKEGEAESRRTDCFSLSLSSSSQISSSLKIFILHRHLIRIFLSLSLSSWWWKNVLVHREPARLGGGIDLILIPWSLSLRKWFSVQKNESPPPDAKTKARWKCLPGSDRLVAWDLFEGDQSHRK